MASPRETVQEAAASGVAALASKVTYGGAGTAGAGWLLSNEFIGAVGVAIALAGLAVNFYFKRKQDRREEAEHEALMERIMRGEKL
jgi:uncharacterized membrane protein YebE (DUF533 family)